MSKRRAWVAWVAFVAIAAAAMGATARAEDKLGIVLLHGMQGTPDDRVIRSFAVALEDAGYLVGEPEMCWSRARIYDKPYPDCLAEIDPEIAKLRGQGAQAIVVAGMSLGGNAALGYGATHPGLKAIVALAPAPDPVAILRNPDVAKAVQKAKDLVAAGKGDSHAAFDVVNTGRAVSVNATPNVFLTFYGEDSPARLPVNAARLTAPLLWVAGTSDPSQRNEPDFAYAKTPPNPLNRFVTVDADHLGTPEAARGAAIAWLKDLMAAK